MSEALKESTKLLVRTRPHPRPTIPHDRKAFTEGLLLHDGFLYESVGLRGKSGVRKTNVATGATEMEATDHMGTALFGEGIVVFGDKLFQLTYKAKKVLPRCNKRSV